MNASLRRYCGGEWAARTTAASGLRPLLWILMLMMLTPLLDEVTLFFGVAPDVGRDANSHGLKIRFEREGFRAAPGAPAQVVSQVWLRRSARV